MVTGVPVCWFFMSDAWSLGSLLVVPSGSVCSAVPCQVSERVVVTCEVVSVPCFSSSAVASCVGFVCLGSESPRESSLEFFFKGALPVSVARWFFADSPACDTLEVASLVVWLEAGRNCCISCGDDGERSLRVCCGFLTMSQAVVSQQVMVVVLSFLFSKKFMYCVNSTGVCSKNCLTCSFRILCVCRGEMLTVRSDLSFAMAKIV